MNIIKFKAVDSTNTWALEHFEELDDSTIVLAESQTNGRGRFSRKWVSEDCENIYLSFVLKPEKQDFAVNFTQYLSVVTAKIINQYGVRSEIKWPNDVLLNGAKVSGILCEAWRKQNLTKGFVLGVGINLNMQESVLGEIERPATSLNIVTGIDVHREEFLEKLVEEFFLNYENILEHGFSFIKKDYLDLINFMGKTVKIQQKDGSQIVEYTAKAIDECGNLVVTDLNGEEQTIYSGDLIL